ncbi:septum site-determining protein MinC [Halobacteroides halobius]|nr:septum site-determining protein MinC [Halobacteroides halobius]
MQRSVVFKADQEGLIILLNEDSDFSEIKASLDNKFEESSNFFKGNTIAKVNLGNRCLSSQQKRELLDIFKKQPGTFIVEFSNNFNSVSDSEPEDDTLLIKRTVRSGQSIAYKGNIVIEGDINPGAEVTAGGDILVMGEVRGITHAGVNGDPNATISAFRLEPIQLRIANHISRAPDDDFHSPEAAEIAFVKEDKIVIDYLK